MGHVRLGKLPASRKWQQVVGYLSREPFCVSGLAEAVSRASDDAFQRARKDPALIETLWLLINVPLAAKSVDFVDRVKTLGLEVGYEPDTLDVVIAVDAAIEAAQRRSRGLTGDLGQLAREAGVSALKEMLDEHLPSMWIPTAEDVRTTLGSLASPARFAEMAHRFFARLITNNLHYFLDRELPRHIGPDKMLGSVFDQQAFGRQLERHSDETALIVRTFSKDWLGKNAFHLNRDIERKDVAGLTHVAFEKIRSELNVRSGSSD